MDEERLSELMSQDLILKEDDHLSRVEEDEEEEEVEEEEEEEDEEEFSFSLAFDGLMNTEQISAEEAFDNGQIKPVFPLFNRDLLIEAEEGIDLENLKLNDRIPNVKKVFLEAPNHDDDEAVGPYCEWSKKAVEVAASAPEGCKKSNSTGFSKIWRFKDLMHRCNSDGRDAFVFLNNNNNSNPSSSSAPATGQRENKVARGETDKKQSVPTIERKVNGQVDGEVGKLKKKLLKSNKKPAPSPHEVYLKSKAKDGRRSYLPYRPELVGFFTNVNGGGLTRNVHPF